MVTREQDKQPISQLDIPLERDGFCRTLVSKLATTLHDVVGLEEASGFISVVGQMIGHHINSEYKQALGTSRLNRQQVVAMPVDLKQRIEGGFYLAQSDEDRVARCLSTSRKHCKGKSPKDGNIFSSSPTGA